MESDAIDRELSCTISFCVLVNDFFSTGCVASCWHGSSALLLRQAFLAIRRASSHRRAPESKAAALRTQP